MSSLEDNLSQYLFTEVPRPNCAEMVEGDFIEYIPGQRLTVAFPVKPEYLNPAHTMQGGIISAAFDNVFGPLCLLVTGTPRSTTIDINTSYHRPIMEGDTLTVIAKVTTRGRTRVFMAGEAYNTLGQLIATSTTNYIMLDRGAKDHTQQ